MRRMLRSAVLDRIRPVLIWCGFTPTQREEHLVRLLASARRAADGDRATVQRLERLLTFREGLGAGSIETPAIRAALHPGEGDLR